MRGLLLAAAAVAAGAQTGFNIDVSSIPTQIRKTIIDSFGSSHAATTLRSTWRQHLVETKSDIDFNHVRFHGILDDDMSTYLNGKANPYLAYDTLDFLVANGVRPLIEISFMPEQLATDTSKTTFHYQGGISPPKDWGAWSTFVTQLVQSFVDRYGATEVRAWRFEVWNEPNCGFYYQGNCCGAGCGNQTAYFELYQHTAAAVKAVDAWLPVGGPSTAQLGWIPEFLAFTAANNVPLDFVSSHLYPSDPSPSITNHTRNGFMDAISNVASLVSAYAPRSIPFLLTEFNAGLGGPLDDPYSGAFVLHHHLTSQAVANLASMSYWTFTDWGFEEDGADPAPWANKFGVRSMYNIPKPVYHALKWISELDTNVLSGVQAVPYDANNDVYRNPYDEVIGAANGLIDAIVGISQSAPDAPVTLTALLANFNISDAPQPGTASIQLNFTDFPTLPPSLLPTSATLEVVDSSHGNPAAVWKSNGGPAWPNATEINTEMLAATVTPVTIPLTQLPDGTGVSATISLEGWAFARVVVQYSWTSA